MIPLQTGFTHPVTHVCFSSCGGFVAVAQPHAGVTVFEHGTGRTVCVCHMPRRAVLTGLTFCAGHIVASHQKGTEAFDAHTGAPVALSLAYTHKALQLADTPDGAYGHGPNMSGTVWKANAPEVLHERVITLTTNKAQVATLSPHARYIAMRWTASGMRLIDSARLRFVADFELTEDVDTRVAVQVRFCPRAERVATCDGHAIRVFDLRELDAPSDDEGEEGRAPRPRERLEPVFVLPPDRAAEVPSWYPPFALLPDGRGLIVKRPRNRIQLWDAPSGVVQNEWSWRLEWVTCVAASPDGLTAAAGGRFGRVLFWDLE
jgi:WD40 repeat protein